MAGKSFEKSTQAEPTDITTLQCRREHREAFKQLRELEELDAYGIQIAISSLRQYLESADRDVHGLAWDYLQDIKQEVLGLESDFNWQHLK